MSTLLVIAAGIGALAGLYFLFAVMWWLSAEPCRRCGKQHWSYDMAQRCRWRWGATGEGTDVE